MPGRLGRVCPRETVLVPLSLEGRGRFGRLSVYHWFQGVSATRWLSLGAVLSFSAGSTGAVHLCLVLLLCGQDARAPPGVAPARRGEEWGER